MQHAAEQRGTLSWYTTLPLFKDFNIIPKSAIISTDRQKAVNICFAVWLSRAWLKILFLLVWWKKSGLCGSRVPSLVEKQRIEYRIYKKVYFWTAICFRKVHLRNPSSRFFLKELPHIIQKCREVFEVLRRRSSLFENTYNDHAFSLLYLISSIIVPGALHTYCTILFHLYLLSHL